MREISCVLIVRTEVGVTVKFDDMPKQRCVCVNCGADITRSMKIYVYGFEGGPYCYDCARTAPKKKRAKSERVKARSMYRLGMKASEIAEKLHCSKAHVYELLNEKKEK